MRRIVAMIPLVVFLSGAAGAVDPEELVRQGNAAFLRQEYDLALRLYSDAEKVISDPALVSINKGATLYRLGKFQEARKHYERCLEEIDEPRRPALLYNLGNCLLQQAQAGNDLQRFEEAVQKYRDALHHPQADPDLQLSIRHNLELAKLLWMQARLRAAPRDPPGKGGDESKPSDPSKPDKQPKSQDPGGDLTNPSTGSNPKQSLEKEKTARIDPSKGKEQAVKVDQTTPGAGNREPIPPKRNPLQDLSEHEARAKLSEGYRPIQEERLKYRLRSNPLPTRDVPDW